MWRLTHSGIAVLCSSANDTMGDNLGCGPMNSLRSIWLIYAVLTWPLHGQEHNRLTPEEKASGWELLFDGTTTKGWRSLTDAAFPRSSWAVEDGTLHSLGEPPDNPWIDLVTTELFGDFELALDWKLS